MLTQTPGQARHPGTQDLNEVAGAEAQLLGPRGLIVSQCRGWARRCGKEASGQHGSYGQALLPLPSSQGPEALQMPAHRARALPPGWVGP